MTAVPRPRAVHHAWIVAAWSPSVMVFGIRRPAGVPGRRPTVEPLAVEV